MRTNIEIDDKLMKQAMKASDATTKKAVVEEALQLMVRIKAQESIRKLFGIGGLDPDYDYKAMRAEDQWAGTASTGTSGVPLPHPKENGVKRGAGKKAA